MVKKILKSLIISILQKFLNIENNEHSADNLFRFADEKYISKIKKQNVTIFDCGAGEGTSILRFKKIFPNCNIHSFEPLDIFYEKLQNKYKNRKDITINYKGVGNKKSIQKFHKLKKYNGSTFLNPNLNSKWFTKDFSELSSESYAQDQNTPEIIEQLVEVNTIDDYLTENNINFIDILKIKTQGSEVNILKGAKNSLSNKKIRFIEVKVIFSDIYQQYNSIGDVENCIKQFNFKLIAVKHFSTNNNFWVDLLYENYNIS